MPIVEQPQSAPEARPSPSDLVLGSRQLNPMQRGAMRYLPHLARNLVIAAPTGSGKTLLAELALAATVADGGLGIYLAPMKAIASEKRADWERLAAAGLRIYKSTGDDDAFDPERARAASVILATPEKLDGILRRGLASDLVDRLRLVVVDEVHMIGDEGRGAGLEALLTRLRLRLPGARLLAMSATIPNAAEIATWLDANLYCSDWRPVPLVSTIHPYTSSGDRQADQEERTRIAAQLAGETVREGGAVLVFCGSRQGVETCAVALARRLALPAVQLGAGYVPHPPPGGGGIAHSSAEGGGQQAGTRGGSLPGVRVSLQQALAGGVGYHHAGLSPRERLGVEELFRSGAIRVLVATSTVAAGVNLPAREVIVRDLTLGMEPIGASALLQMAGTGRPTRSGARGALPGDRADNGGGASDRAVGRAAGTQQAGRGPRHLHQRRDRCGRRAQPRRVGYLVCPYPARATLPRTAAAAARGGVAPVSRFHRGGRGSLRADLARPYHQLADARRLHGGGAGRVPGAARQPGSATPMRWRSRC